MEYQLQLKPFIRKDGQKYKIIQLTDIALHTAKKQATRSIGKKIKELFDFKKPIRIYSPIQLNKQGNQTDKNSFTVEVLRQDPDFQEMVRNQEANGYKILLEVSKGGIPVVMGKDTQVFIKSKNGQRILRKFAKNDDQR
ncbi:MAG: hypothetical protein WC518_02575 [Patescibacteria group bacterium]